MTILRRKSENMKVSFTLLLVIFLVADSVVNGWHTAGKLEREGKWKRSSLCTEYNILCA